MEAEESPIISQRAPFSDPAERTCIRCSFRSSRNIRSSDPARTPYLLQNPRLQELLRAEPGAWLQISPLQTGAQEHLVSVRKDAEHLEESVDSKGRAAGRDVPNQRKLYAESGFREQMDGLVEMAQTARDWASLWPRGHRPPDGMQGGSA